MSVEVRVLPNTYFDSVFLMGIAGRLGKQTGIKRTAALMGTPKNRAALIEFGAPAEALEECGPSDLVLAVEAAEAAQAGSALVLVDSWLQEEAAQPAGGKAASLESAVQMLPEANLAVISVPGEYAAYEARRALEQGLHVFLFSDNVTLEDEVALKREAAQRGLLVMGPDCGTAIIAGAGIGFANAVRRGGIGVVGPSGTGMQQITTLVHQAGEGISHAIGTGSHDLSDAVGGITTLAALDALAEDEDTKVIVLVSKPPGPAAKKRVLEWISRSDKPVITCFLGEFAKPRAAEASGSPEAAAGGVSTAPLPTVRYVLSHSLEAAANTAVQTLRRSPPELTLSFNASIGRPHLGQFVRGLFAGGTFCYEAQQLFLSRRLPVRSNAPLRPEDALSDPLRSEGHSLIDLGADEFTQGRPHPMIDATLRRERILVEAADPGVGVLLLDFILGYGAAADPVGDTLPAIKEAQRIAHDRDRNLLIVASVCGTDDDPQVLSGQVAALQAAGVQVLPSNHAAAEAAASAVQSFAEFTEGWLKPQ